MLGRCQPAEVGESRYRSIHPDRRTGEIANTATEGVEYLDYYFSVYFVQIWVAIAIPVFLVIAIFSHKVKPGFQLPLIYPPKSAMMPMMPINSFQPHAV